MTCSAMASTSTGCPRASHRTSPTRWMAAAPTCRKWFPGSDISDDPLLQARLFSYLDTQLTRLGGPNFAQIPINAPVSPVNDMFRDGFHQHRVPKGIAPYKPNSLDGGCPYMSQVVSGQ